MSQYFFDSESGDWQPHPQFEGAFVRPLITPRQNPGLTAARVRLLPDAGLPPHSHPHSAETFYVLRGVIACRVGNEEMEMRPGQMGYAPPGVEHTVQNRGREPVEALSFFNPPLDQNERPHGPGNRQK